MKTFLKRPGKQAATGRRILDYLGPDRSWSIAEISCARISSSKRSITTFLEVKAQGLTHLTRSQDGPRAFGQIDRECAKENPWRVTGALRRLIGWNGRRKFAVHEVALRKNYGRAQAE
ncbi:hypothetical protein [Dokdonella fugitiva]|uniref:hypothetical protein n=1 Tax=Dokdonella fugitiva TaxID=328517 RepID=UPI0015FDAE53|nr:hypothetical protein [Dokdonella fugitiva]